MKLTYKGHDIEVTREKCNGGWMQTHYSVFRLSNGMECITDFSDGSDSINEWVRILKERIDSEIASGNPWDQNGTHDASDSAINIKEES